MTSRDGFPVARAQLSVNCVSCQHADHQPISSCLSASAPLSLLRVVELQCRCSPAPEVQLQEKGVTTMLGRGGDGGGKGSSQSGWWARDVAPRKRASRSAQEKVTALDEQARSDKRLQQSVKARMWTLQRSPVVCSDCCRQKREGRFGARCALPESEEGNGRDKTRQPLPRLTCLVAGVSCCRRRRRPRHTHRERGRVVVRSSSAARVRPVGSWDGWVCCGTCVLRCACVACAAERASCVVRVLRFCVCAGGQTDRRGVCGGGCASGKHEIGAVVVVVLNAQVGSHNSRLTSRSSGPAGCPSGLSVRLRRVGCWYLAAALSRPLWPVLAGGRGKVGTCLSGAAATYPQTHAPAAARTHEALEGRRPTSPGAPSRGLPVPVPVRVPARREGRGPFRRLRPGGWRVHLLGRAWAGLTSAARMVARPLAQQAQQAQRPI